MSNPLYTMYDDVTQSLLPAGAYAYGAYTNGTWENYNAVKAAHPTAHILGISVTASAVSDCLDIENGDATPGQAPGWYRKAKGKRPNGLMPVLYSMASQYGTVIQIMTNAGIPRREYVVWSAHVGAGEHICGPGTCGFGPGANGTQWTWTALGRNLDQSIIDGSFFGAPKPPGPARAVEVKPGYWRQVAGHTTALSESLAAYARARGVTAPVLVSHTTGTGTPERSHNLAEFRAYVTRGTGNPMPTGLVFYTFNP